MRLRAGLFLNDCCQVAGVFMNQLQVAGRHVWISRLGRRSQGKIVRKRERSQEAVRMEYLGRYLCAETAAGTRAGTITGGGK